MGLFFGKEQRSDFLPQQAQSQHTPSFLEEVSAAYRSFSALNLSFSEESLVYDQWSPIVDVINERMPSETPLKNPVIANQFSSYVGRQLAGRGDDNFDESSLYYMNVQNVLNKIFENPDVFPEYQDLTHEQILEQAKKEALDAKAEYENIQSRTSGTQSFFAGLLGGGGAVVKDPVVVLPALVTGAYSGGKSLWHLAFREATVSAGSEILVQKEVSEWYDSLGLEYTPEQFWTAVSTAGIAGGVLPPAIVIGGKTIRLTAEQAKQGYEVIKNSGLFKRNKVTDAIDSAAEGIDDAIKSNPLEDLDEHVAKLQEAETNFANMDGTPFTGAPSSKVVRPSSVYDSDNTQGVVQSFDPNEIEVDPGLFRLEGEPAPASKYQELELGDTRGKGVQYHGARGEITQLTEGYYSSANIYGGEGTFYTTDAFDIATGYQRKKQAGVVYKTTEKVPVNFFDMESRLSPDEWDQRLLIQNDLYESAVDVFRESEKNPNLREIMDEMREMSSGFGYSRDDVQEIFSSITYSLEREGFGGMTHVGGLKTNKKPHTVKIYFRPEEQIDLEIVPKGQFKILPEKPKPESLVSEEPWSDVKSGQIVVYEYADGRKVILDGEKRLARAKAEGKKLNGQIIREVDGFTPEMARVVRETIDSTGDSAIRIQTNALLNLGDDGFMAMAKGIIPTRYAAIIGDLIPDDEVLQNTAIAAVSKANPENGIQAEAIVRQVIGDGADATKQADLFSSDIVSEALYAERAKVLDMAIKALKNDKKSFKQLLEGRGDDLAKTYSKSKVEADAKAISYVQTLANQSGELSTALNDAARLAKESGNYRTPARGFTDAVRRSIESGDFNRLEAGNVRQSVYVTTQKRPNPNVAEVALRQFDDPASDSVSKVTDQLEEDLFGEVQLTDEMLNAPADVRRIDPETGEFEFQTVREALQEIEDDAAIMSRIGECVR